MRRSIILVLLLLLGSSPASARVWRVEKNGTGDFTVIQQAIEASSAGDTIRIGPGRFDDKFLWGNPPWQQYTRVLVTKPDLTFIGAGASATIIGDAVPLDADHDHDSALANATSAAGANLFLSEIGFENCYFGVYLYDIGTATVSHCRFRGNDASAIAHVQTGLAVEDCQFESLSDAYDFAAHVVAWGPGHINVARSALSASRIHLRAHEHVHLEGVVAATVADCTLEGGAIGIYAASGAGLLTVRDSVIDDQFNKGIVHEMGAGTIRVSDTVMRNQYTAFSSIAPGAIWELDRVVVEEAITCSFVFVGLGGGHIRNSQLAKGVQYVVMDSSSGTRSSALTFDMTNNWWGTANSDSIQAWIYDGNDQPTRPFYFIDWDPYRSVPVSSEKRSLGGVKALFR